MEASANEERTRALLIGKISELTAGLERMLGGPEELNQVALYFRRLKFGNRVDPIAQEEGEE